MSILHYLFPSFERPVARPRYLHIERKPRDFRGIGTLLLLAVSCGVAFALWEPAAHAPSPFVTASLPRPAPAEVAKVRNQETTAAAEAEDNQQAPTVKLSAACAQRPTARRDCADVKALKEARLKPADPAAAPTDPAQGIAAKDVAPVPAKAETVNNDSADSPGAQVQRTAAPKQKRTRQQEDAPIERLVRVYDQVMPDGRRVPVYRRANGALEMGTVVDGEYRQNRRADLNGPSRPPFFFGLQ